MRINVLLILSLVVPKLHDIFHVSPLDPTEFLLVTVGIGYIAWHARYPGCIWASRKAENKQVMCAGTCTQVLSLKGIRSSLDMADFEAIAALRQLEELVLDCDQPPEPEAGVEEIKWGLPEFPEGMLHLVNMTHLTLSCHYGIIELPPGITSLNKLEVRRFVTKLSARYTRPTTKSVLWSWL